MVARRRVLVLLDEVLLGVGADRPDLGVERLVAGAAADERRQLRAPEVAEHVDEEEPVLGGRVADPELGLGARGTVDVRDAEAPVAFDRDAWLRLLGRLELPRTHAEGGVAVVVAERRIREAPVAR